MVTSFSVMNSRTELLKEEYKVELEGMDLKELVKEFLSYLDYTEESDSGRVFHPITIGSCRVLMAQPLNMCMEKLREEANIID